MTIQQKPILHARDHAPGGADPIPGLAPAASGSYAEQVLAEPSLVGYWPLDDAAEPALDHSTSGRNLTTPSLEPTWQQPGPFSGLAEATSVLFAAADGWTVNTDHLQDSNAGASYQFAGVDPYTFEILVFALEVPTLNQDGIMGVFSYPGGSPGGIYLTLGNAGKVRALRAGSSWITPNTLNLNTWVHVAMTYDGATLKVYFDGAEQLSQATTAPHSASGLLKLATYWGDGSGDWRGNLHGRLAQAAIYNTALDASTVASHANTFKGGGGNEGWILSMDENGNPVWTPPASVTVNGQAPTNTSYPAQPPQPTDPTGIFGSELDWIIDQPLLYGGGDFDVQPNKWTTIPFANAVMERESTLSGTTQWTELAWNDPAAAGWINASDTRAITIPHDMLFLPGEGKGWMQVCLFLETPAVLPSSSHRGLRIFETTRQKAVLQGSNWRNTGCVEGGGINAYRPAAAWGGSSTIFASGDTGALNDGGHPDVMFMPSYGWGYNVLGNNWLPKDASTGQPMLKQGMRLVAQVWHDASHNLTFRCGATSAAEGAGLSYRSHFVFYEEVERAWGSPWSDWPVP